MIGLITTYAQQFISLVINKSKLLSKHYEPPTNLNERVAWWRALKSLDSFNKGIKDARQLALFGAFFDIGLKLAVFRQFNSGWQINFGGFEYSYYRKIVTILGAMVVTSPFAVAGDMALRAYNADKTFPKELQKGYTSYFNTLRRIPFEEGPYYLFKNSFPLYAKHILGPFTAFFSYDWLIDKMSVMWRTTDNPILPIKMFCAGFASYLGAVFAYPFAVATKDMVDMWPKKDGIDPFKGNYRAAATWLWYGPSWNIGFVGLFKRYFWNVFPLYFSSILLADQFGMFSYWRIDILSGASDNTAEDSYI